MQIKSAARERRIDLLAAAAYLVAALVFLLPLPLHWATFIPGDNGDSHLNLWPFWYYPHALFSGGGLFSQKLLFYPEGIQMVFTSASPIGAVLMTPVSLGISAAAALNCWLLLHLWLGGFFLFRFCRQLDCGPWAAWLGGFAFAWSPFIAVHITGHYTLVQVAYTALALYSLATLIRRVVGWGNSPDSADSPDSSARTFFSWKTLVAPAVALALSCWAVAVTDFYLAVMTLSLLLAALAHFALNKQTRPALFRKAFWVALVSAATCTVVLLLPWVVAIMRAQSGHDYSAIDPFMGSKNTAPWSRLITLPAYHSIWEPMFFQSFMGKISLFNEWAYLGMTAFFVAGVGMLYVRPWRRSAVWIVTFVIILGLGFGNHYSYERGYANGIFSIGRWWPTFFPFSQFRVPARWQFALCTVLAVGLAIGADALFYRRAEKAGATAESGRFKRAFIAILITAAIAFDQMRWPLPICDARPLDDGIATTGDGTVLDIPVGIISGQGHSLGQYKSATLRRQMIHGRPLISANASRLPNDVVAHLKTDPELTAFFAIQDSKTTAVQDAITSSALNWPGFIQRYNITTVRIPTDWPTSASLHKLINKTSPNNWTWHTASGAIIGNLNR